MTIQQHASFDSSAAELNATSKLVKAWESKNAKNAAKAGGISLMALSLAACGGSSDTTNAAASDDTAAADPVADDGAADDGGTTPVATGLKFTIDSDELIGTSDDDAFVAKIVQSPFGNTADSLTSADSVDGQGGADSLHAVLTPQNEQVGDTQPTIVNVETITIEARDVVEFNNHQGTVVFDGKDITGHDSIGSFNSDGDLVIENLNTLTDSGAIRLTSDITVTMAYTDNFNSDNDASDLTVYFDEDYLNTSVTTSGSTLLVHVVNVITNVVVGNPLSGTSTLSVNVGGTEVIVDVSAIAADATLTAATAYAATAEAINAAMTAAGFTTVTATAQTATPAVFSIGVTVDGTAYATGDSAGDYSPILLTNTGAEELTKGKFSQAETGVSESDINAFMTSTVASNADVPISINIDLEKVGRDGDGGDLIVGGKDLGSQTNTDVDQNDGIEVFNINVIGDEDKPSNLGSITSTNEALRTVNIATDAGEDGTDGYAALTVRGTAVDGPFGPTLDSLNANNFLGDLYIGETFMADNIDNFTATGGGDVTLNMVEGVGGAVIDLATTGTVEGYGEGVGEGLASSGALLRGVTTGAGDDTIVLDIMGGAQAVVNTGGGDDTFTASINGNTTSESTESYLDLTSASGDNTVTLSTVVGALSNANGPGGLINAAEVDLGTGDDTVTGGSVALTVDTGAGDDVIYADNTGDKAVALANAGYVQTALTALNGVGIVQLMGGKELVVTVAMPDADANSAIQLGNANSFVNGYEVTVNVGNAGALTTEADVTQTIADAINNDAVLSKLAVAEVNTLGDLTVTYLVDGGANLGMVAAVSVDVAGTYAALSTADKGSLLTEYQELVGDSTITAGALETAYDLNIGADAILIDHVALGGVSVIGGGNNIVNGGLGDDVIVLSSGNNFDTLQIDAGGFGDDVIVHFDVAGAQDVLDFAWLDNTVGTATSSSAVTATVIAGTFSATSIAVVGNEVFIGALGDLTDNDATAAAALTFSTLNNEAAVLAEMNDAGGQFTGGALAANAIGTVAKNVMLVEDAANEGYFSVFEVTYDTVAGDFTNADLVGSLDFGESADLVNLGADGNIA